MSTNGSGAVAKAATGNGKARYQRDKVRVAIIGVGNCANSLLQGVEYYKDAPSDEFVPGLMHVDLGGYHVRDIEFTAAFDVTTAKVGKDLADAIWAEPNDTIKFADVAKTGVKVSRGMTHDGIGSRAVRVVVLSAGLLFADGLGLGDFSLLAASVYVLAAMGIITVGQRIMHVRTELNAAGTVVNDL